MFIKVILTFLLASIVSFLVLPLEVISIGGGPGVFDELAIYRHYEWFGAIRQADDIINYPVAYITNSFYYEPLIRLAVESLILGLAVTFLLYFFIYRKKSKN
jgi:hypothetical protein